MVGIILSTNGQNIQKYSNGVGATKLARKIQNDSNY